MGRKKKAAGIGLMSLAIIMLMFSNFWQTAEWAAYELFSYEIPKWIMGPVALVSLAGSGIVLYYALKNPREAGKK